MTKNQITLGPVLSFRGVSKGRWRVTALIGVAAAAGAPECHVDGKPCPSPVVLHTDKRAIFLRYDISVKMSASERRVEFGLPDLNLTWHYTVPGKGFAPRMAYVSCNGFSDPSGMRKLVRGENAVWEDLLCNHDASVRPKGYKLDKEQMWHEARTHAKGLQRFHLMLMGGDQIYFDSIWEDVPELADWVSLSRKEQLAFAVSSKLEQKIENYYLELYNQRWLPASRLSWSATDHPRDAADAMARIPTVMMWDDHDIFDGWGSYSTTMQNCPLFKTLFRHARRSFWVFQLQHRLEDLPELVPVTQHNTLVEDPLYEPIDWAAHRVQDELALPILDGQPGFTMTHSVGPIGLLIADLRTERSRTQVLGSATWAALKKWTGQLKSGSPTHPGDVCQHLLVMSSVPVIHPKLSAVEGLLDTFGQDHVLDSNADDLKDHWSHDDHEGERKRLIEILGQVAAEKSLRVSFVSGDVHVAAWGTSYRKDVPFGSNTWHLQQFTSSAVVHPSLMGVAERLFLFMLNGAARQTQTIDVMHTLEMMLFPGYNKYVMPARNWLALELDLGKDGSKLWATWRCETEGGFSNHLLAVQPANRAAVAG